MEVPRTTVQDWVFKGAVPKSQHLDTLNNFIAATCAHHWAIESANGPLSEGVYQRETATETSIQSRDYISSLNKSIKELS